MLTFLTPRLEKIFPFGGLPCLELAFSAPRIENFFLFGGLNVVLCQLGSPTREMILIFRGPPASEVALHYPRGRPSTRILPQRSPLTHYPRGRPSTRIPPQRSLNRVVGGPPPTRLTVGHQIHLRTSTRCAWRLIAQKNPRVRLHRARGLSQSL